MLRLLCSVLLIAIAFSLEVSLTLSAPLSQLDPAVRDRVLPAAVEIAIILETTENGTTRSEYVPIGSGTIVSPTGLILTNWHVVDMDALRELVETWEAQEQTTGNALTYELDPDHVVILSSDQTDIPEPQYLADVVSQERELDFAVLQITADEAGQPIDPAGLAMPYIQLGDSSSLIQGDPIHIFAYPGAGGGTLQYTPGVVSGFQFEDGIDGRAWIVTNATMSGGSSGGTAVDRDGRLIGVPTQGSQLDCRPGDTNGDGRIDAADVGCIPVGGSFGELRPINLARDVLAHAGWRDTESAGDETPTATDTTARDAKSTSTAATDGWRPDEPTSPIIESTAAANSYIFAEDYCRTGPIYPPGTRIVLTRGVWEWGMDLGLYSSGISGALFYQVKVEMIPAGTEVEIAGPYREDGACDLWPIRYRTADGVEKETYVDEWDLSPEYPNQVVPLPPEWQTLTSEMEQFCLSNPDYAEGTVMVLAHDASLYSYHRGYLFEHWMEAPAATQIEIVGPPVEAGVCDMWPIHAFTSDTGAYPYSGYIHESAFQLATT